MANIKVRVGQQNATKVVSSLSGTRTISLASLSDVDIGSGLQNGQVLVFNATTQKFDLCKDNCHLQFFWIKYFMKN